jgi:hypothetical protein
MVKIIPFAVAVIIVLAVGFYLFTSKISKNPGSGTLTTENTQNVSPTGVVPPNGTSTESAKVTPTPNVNQITLTVTAPADNATVTSPNLTVRGVTKPGAEVSVNETDVVANGNGNFSANITLEEGDNYIVVVAVDVDGQVAEAELTATYTPAE